MDFNKYIDQGITYSQEFIKLHGQQAWEVVLWLTIVDSLQWIVLGFFFIILSIISGCFYTFKFNPEFKNTKYSFDNNNYEAAGAKSFISLALSIIALLPAAVNLLNIWNWVGIFYPELYLAKQAIDKVLN